MRLLRLFDEMRCFLKYAGSAKKYSFNSKIFSDQSVVCYAINLKVYICGMWLCCKNACMRHVQTHDRIDDRDWQGVVQRILMHCIREGRSQAIGQSMQRHNPMHPSLSVTHVVVLFSLALADRSLVEVAKCRHSCTLTWTSNTAHT